jgi:hypothetical protein
MILSLQSFVFVVVVVVVAKDVAGSLAVVIVVSLPSLCWHH